MREFVHAEILEFRMQFPQTPEFVIMRLHKRGLLSSTSDSHWSCRSRRHAAISPVAVPRARCPREFQL
jgi:hypothetical protein